jgi:drug/metabolite transporter (DMT)-like permease
MLYADTPTKRRIGILLGSLTTIFFSILDTCGKWLATHIPLMEIVWFRFAFASLIVLLVMIPKGSLKGFWKEDIKLQIVRAIMMCAMTILNFAGLKYLQLAQANSILFSAPIIIAVLSTLFLKEKLSLAKWLAIAAGFIGVLVILDPFGNEFHPAMFFIIGHACIYALFNLLTRRMASTANPESTIVFSCVLPTLFLIPFVIPVWQSPSNWIDYLVFFIAGLFGFLGHYVLVIAYRYAKPTTISPFFYQQILYMIFLGWLVFNQIPSHHVFLGALVVVASGLYLWFMENRLDKHA